MMKKQLFFYLAALMISFICIQGNAQTNPSSSNILYVDINVSGGNESGNSWANAIPELADAMKWAKLNENNWSSGYPLKIFVAKGTYKPKYGAGDVWGSGGPSFSGYPDGRKNTFLMVKNVQLYGGFDPDNGIADLSDNRLLPSMQNPEEGTILSGDVNGDDNLTGSGESLSFTNISENNYHVMISTTYVGSASLDGFTITGANADYSLGIYVNGVLTNCSFGGGIYIEESSPTLTDVTFRGNRAEYGGGIYISGSSPTLTNLTLHKNEAAVYGGGLYNLSNASPSLTNLTVKGNKAGYGAGMANNDSSPTMVNSTLNENYATDYGGGIYNGDSSTPNFSDLTLSNNKAEYGGGIFNGGSSTPDFSDLTLSNNEAKHGGGMANLGASPTLTNSIVNNNTATVEGGGIYSITDSHPILTNVSIKENTANGNGGGVFNWGGSPNMKNVLISGNTSSTVGGAIYNYLNSNTTLTNVTIIGNSPSTNGNDIYNYASIILSNSIVWDHIVNIDNGSDSATYSLIKWRSNTSNGNIDATGLTKADIFNDPANGDYSLFEASSVINSGSNSKYTNAGGTLPGDLDLAGNPRLYDGLPSTDIIDLGAYELQGERVTSKPDDNNILYVDKNVTEGGLGNSWDNAIPELADALKWAKNHQTYWASGGIDSLQIFVAKGTYKPLYNPADANFGNSAGRKNAFLMVKNVQVYGGFDPNNGIVDLSDDRMLPSLEGAGGGTILSGDVNDDDVITGSGTSLNITNNSENTYHVVISSSDVGSSRLDGFTVTGGYADFNGLSQINGEGISKRSGGGVITFNSSPYLANLRLNGNYGYYSGGMHNEGSSPILNKVIISKNLAASGAGMWNIDSSPSLINVSLIGNKANTAGGMYSRNSSPNLTNVVVRENSSADLAGGLLFTHNCFPSLLNVVITGNTAGNFYGGLKHNGGGSLVNCTISGNSPDELYVYGDMVWKNTIVWGDKGGSGYSTHNCLIKGSSTTNNGNIDASGLTKADIFNDPDNGNYTLKATSEAINAGNNIAYTNTGGDLQNDKDLAGNPRLYTGNPDPDVIDMGAYEFQAEPTPTNNDCENAITLSCGETVVGNTVNATESGIGTPSCAGGTPKDVFYTLNVNAGNEYTISVNGSDYDGVLAIYNGSCSNLNEDYCADNGFVTDMEESITFIAGTTETLVIRTYDWSSTGGNFNLSVSCVEASDFVYEDGSWTPSDPSGVSTVIDNILVVNGSTNLTADTDINNITVDAGATFNIEQVLNLNGNITNNGNLIFKSTANYDGELDEVPSGSTITGDVTVERYTSDQRAFRYVSSAVNTSDYISDNWQQNTHITGSTEGNNGFDATGTGNPSMFTLNVGAQAFDPIDNTDNTKLNAGDPYMLYVRGDRSIDLTDNSSHGSTVLKATGELHTGPMTQSFSGVNNGDFVDLGNPYQSAVDLSSVIGNSTGINTDYAYVYDPTMGSMGAYVTVTLADGSNSTGTGAGSSEADQYLQPGQAVQIEATGPVDINFAESDKNPGKHRETFGNDNPFTNNAHITGRLFTAENHASGGSLHDGFSILFNDNFDNALNNRDATKAFNFTENMGIGTPDNAYSIERRQLPVEGEDIALFNANYENQEYTLVFDVSEFANATSYLVDTYTGEQIELEAGENVIDFMVDSSLPGSVATDRFSIHFGPSTLSVDDQTAGYGIELYPNPMESGAAFYITAGQFEGQDVNVSITDLLGKTVYTATKQFNGGKIAVKPNNLLNSGVYFVKIAQGDKAVNKRLVVK